MRLYEFRPPTNDEIRRARQQQALNQNLLLIAQPKPQPTNVSTANSALPFAHLLQRRHTFVPNTPELGPAKSPLQQIQKDKIDKLAGKFTSREAALQRKVTDDDVIMAMRKSDAAKKHKQKMPKMPVSA